MNEDELKKRTKEFGLAVLDLIEALPRTTSGRIIANQLGRSGTSIGCNYRAACRGRSKAEFTSRRGIVEEEADESAYWLEIIRDRAMKPADEIAPLLQEANELIAIMTSSRKTLARSPNQNSRIKNQKSQCL